MEQERVPRTSGGSPYPSISSQLPSLRRVVWEYLECSEASAILGAGA